MPNLKNLSVSLTANTTKFTSGMKGASGSISGFASKVSGFAASIAKVGAVAVGAGLAMTTALVKKGLASVDATAKVSDKLGISTEKLIGLQHAADLSGVSVNTFNTAMQRMVRRVAEAAQGGGPAASALKDLGLNAQALAKLSPDRQMSKIADAMKGVKSQGDKVALAFKLFDSKGVNLINTLSGGSAALQSATKEAESLGLSFTRIDAAKVEMANDSMNKLGKLVKGVAQQLAIQFSPVITAVSEKLVHFFTKSISLSGLLSKGFGFLKSNLLRFAKVIDVVAGVWNFLKGITLSYVAFTIKGWAKIIGFITNTVGKMVDLIVQVPGAFIDGINLLISLIPEAIRPFDEIPTGGLKDFEKEVRTGIAGSVDFVIDKLKSAEGFARGLDRSAGAAFNSTMKSADDFNNNTTGQNLAQTFIDIEQRAKKIAATSSGAGKGGGGLFDLGGGNKAAKVIEGLKAKAKGIFEATRTPFEKFKADFGELKTLFSLELIDPETFKRAVGQLGEKVKAALPAPSDPGKFARKVNTSLVDISFGSSPSGRTITKGEEKLIALQEEMKVLLGRISSKAGATGTFV